MKYLNKAPAARHLALGMALLFPRGESCFASAQDGNWVIVLPANLQSGSAANIKILLGDLMMRVAPGDHVVAIDGTNFRQIATVSVPLDETIRGNSNYRVKTLLRAGFNKIYAFINSGTAARERAGDVNIPRLLVELPSVLDSLPSRNAEVLVAGSMIYDDPRESGFAMAGGRVPYDGNFRATQDKTPYGVANKSRALEGTTVHFCGTDPDAVWTSELFKARVARTWAVMTRLMGGQFGSFGPLDAGCNQRFLTHAVSREVFQIDEGDRRLGMTKPERRAITDAPQASRVDAQSLAPPLQARALFSAPECAGLPATPVGPVTIGIKWTAQVDLDLYARVDGGDWLYFGHKADATGNGQHIYDWTSPPAGTEGFEVVEYEQPADVRNLHLAVNLYGGTSSGGVPYQIKLWFGGCAYTDHFRIQAAVGNGGANMGSLTPQWNMIDPLAVMKSRNRSTPVPPRAS
jgi:hypothetical protein